jgi:two-component sensor histidine kinase
MVACSQAPLLLLDGGLGIIAASESFCAAFHVSSTAILGTSVFGIGKGEWDLPKLRSLLSATASGHAAIDAYELDLTVAGEGQRRLVIKANKLAYGDPDSVRLLMTIQDVTEARLAEATKDNLLREKAILLQEIQHRVANSLQIIASVLMQSARNVQSEETRSHLNDARNRVMSIATVQKQLTSVQDGRVQLRSYFEQLRDSLSASMIRDHTRQSIELNIENCSVTANVSVSLVLIVTELVINALKHAFPEERAGKIIVDYHRQGPNWTLSVADNGVGMPRGGAVVQPGLGTSLVEALARQLNARVQVADSNPGTAVSIVHAQIAAVGSGEDAPVGRAV